jgi:hypothetical protein
MKIGNTKLKMTHIVSLSEYVKVRTSLEQDIPSAPNRQE